MTSNHLEISFTKKKVIKLIYTLYLDGRTTEEILFVCNNLKKYKITDIEINTIIDEINQFY